MNARASCTKDSHGWLPIHLAAHVQAPAEVSLELLRLPGRREEEGQR